MRDVSLTLLQTFYVVAREGSYSAASRRLGMSYQSAANHVRRLEQIVGGKLVDSERGAKTTRLTGRGKGLFHLLEPELDTMLTRLNYTVSTGRSMIRAGMPQGLLQHLFQPVIKGFWQQHPDVEMLCYERDSSLVELVKSGQLDVFITEREVSDKDVRQHFAGAYGLVLVHPAHWPAPQPGALAEWANGRPFVTYESGHLLLKLAAPLLERDGMAPRTVLATSASSSIRRFVEAGMGFGLLPSWVAGEASDQLGVVPLHALPQIPVYFGEAAFLSRNPFVAALRELCLARFPAIFAGAAEADPVDPPLPRNRVVQTA